MGIHQNQKGFTIVELVLVLTLLGIVAVVAIPQFINLTAQAETSAMKGVIGSVRTGIGLFRSENLANGGNGIPPQGAPALDSVALGTFASDQSPLFTTILQNGITDSHWQKSNGNNNGYIYHHADGSITIWTYDTGDGSVDCVLGCP